MASRFGDRIDCEILCADVDVVGDCDARERGIEVDTRLHSILVRIRILSFNSLSTLNI